VQQSKLQEIFDMLRLKLKLAIRLNIMWSRSIVQAWTMFVDMDVRGGTCKYFNTQVSITAKSERYGNNCVPCIVLKIFFFL